jgi:hypothetical protein
MVGSMNRVPIRMNSWLEIGEAASYRLMDGGTMFGQMLNAWPI